MNSKATQTRALASGGERARRRARARSVSAALAMLTSAVVAAPAFSSVPSTVAIDGRLRSGGGGPAADGDYKLTFSLYASKAANKATWSETATVKVKSGGFSHVLGSIKSLPAKLDSASSAWLGLSVGQDPELPRQPLHAVAYARRAAGADAAAVASDLKCTGCVSVSEMKFDGSVDLGGHSLTAKTGVFTGGVAATQFIGDGSKLTGIKMPNGKCKSGEMVGGINADGSLQCVKAAAGNLPPDGLGAISNNLLKNVFDEVLKSKTTPKGIPDNKPGGILDEIVVADLGIAKKLSISVDLKNSDISSLEVVLYDPNNKPYVLHKKNGVGGVLKTTYPTLTKPVSGDLSVWIGKNPKGTWRLIVTDWKKTAGGSDGQLLGWSVDVQTLSTKKVGLNGSLVINNKSLKEILTKALTFKCKHKGVNWMKGPLSANTSIKFTVGPVCGAPGFIAGYFRYQGLFGTSPHIYSKTPHITGTISKTIGGGGFEITCKNYNNYPRKCYGYIQFICCESSIDL